MPPSHDQPGRSRRPASSLTNRSEPSPEPTYSTPFGPTPFTLAEAAGAGLSDDRLRVMAAAGVVRRVLRGVYVDATVVVDSLDLRGVAVAKAAPPGRVLCRRTAAWLWGVDAMAMGAHRQQPPIDVMGRPGEAATRRDGVSGSTGPMDPADVVLLGGLLVTTPARTAADLGRTLCRPDALAALDQLVALPGASGAEVLAVLDRFSGHRGVRQARELTALADPRAESPQESRTRLRCVDAGFPCPEPQIWVYDKRGILVGRLDMGWDAVLKAVEFDGSEGHSTAKQQAHDRVRRKKLRDCGWGVAVVTGEHVLSRSLVFENGIGELLSLAPRLTRHHPRYGGWDVPGGRAA